MHYVFAESLLAMMLMLVRSFCNGKWPYSRMTASLLQDLFRGHPSMRPFTIRGCLVFLSRRLVLS